MVNLYFIVVSTGLENEKSPDNLTESEVFWGCGSTSIIQKSYEFKI